MVKHGAKCIQNLGVRGFRIAANHFQKTRNAPDAVYDAERYPLSCDSRMAALDKSLREPYSDPFEEVEFKARVSWRSSVFAGISLVCHYAPCEGAVTHTLLDRLVFRVTGSCHARNCT